MPPCVEVRCAPSTAKFDPLCNPTSLPVGIKQMIGDPANQVICLPGQMTRYHQDAVIITGSGYHILNGFSPMPPGVVPDIGKKLMKEGRVGRFTVAETIEGINRADSVKIRKNPLDVEEKKYRAELAEMSAENGDDVVSKKAQLERILEHKKKQLEAEKKKTITWLLSLSKTPDRTFLCPVRNTFVCGTNIPTKPVWCTGTGKKWVMDFGTGKAVLVDGRTGCQQGEYFEYDFDELVSDPTSLTSLTAKVIQQFEDTELELDFQDVACFATGKWREHPDTFKALQGEITKKGIQCDLLTPRKEALFGSVSALTIMAPYFPEVETFFTIELGGGSTQFMMFDRKKK